MGEKASQRIGKNPKHAASVRIRFACKLPMIDIMAMPAKKTASPFSLRREDYHSLASLRYALRKFLRFSKDLLGGEARLTPEQYEALLALKAFSATKGLTVGELSERVQVKHHTAVSLSDKLAARKLVTKRRGRVDRRYAYVKLTPSGSKLLTTLAAAHRREIAKHAPEIIKSLKQLKK
jgi:DNA-binding MarR family transcriptional regulator